jgi:hypothetical protein
MWFAAAGTFGVLLLGDFLLYESSGASDCDSCSLGQTLLGWGLIVLPVVALGCVAVGVWSRLQLRSR